MVEGETVDDEGRFLALEYDKFWLVHTYVSFSLNLSGIWTGVS